MKKIWSTLLILALVLNLAACSQSQDGSNPSDAVNTEGTQTAYKAGTYQGTAKGHNGDVVVEVTLSEDKIEKVEVVENQETPEIAAKVLENIPAAIVENQSLAIDAVTGATVVSNAIIEAAANALTSAGVDVAALQTPIEKSTTGEVKNLTADIVIVGAGAAGTAAALEASESGAKVIVLEKADVPGGASKLAGGIFAIDSKDQAAAGVAGTFTLLDILKGWQESTCYLSDSNLFYTAFKDSGKTADWLEENGFDFTYVGYEQAAHKDDYGTYHAYTDADMKLQYYNNALKIVEDRGGQIFYETEAKELMGDSNEVKGVIAEQADGTRLEIEAKSVILATGGAGANAELVKEIHGFDLMNITSGTQTGDAITMTKAIGAGEGNTIAELHGVTVPGNPAVLEREPLTYLAYYSGSIFINQNGSRFVEEDISFDTALVANAAYQQGEQYYSIMSSDMINTLEKQGPSAYGKVDGVNYQVGVPLYPVDQPWTGLTASLEKGIEDGVVVKGETLQELAEKIGVDPATLEQTFNQYNQFAQNGKDDMFGKDPLYLVEMKEGPYYAVVTIPASLGQLGGIAVDSNLRVLNTEGNIINNLYLAGNDVASIYNNSYPTVEGVTLAFAFNTGRLAAQYAVAAAK